jgi:hypothetical protein
MIPPLDASCVVGVPSRAPHTNCRVERALAHELADTLPNDHLDCLRRQGAVAGKFTPRGASWVGTALLRRAGTR